MSLHKIPFRLIINLFGKPRLKRFSKPPVFIGGCGRSGTTLLLSILSAHRELFCIPKELGIFNGAEVKDDKLILKNAHRFYQGLLFNKIPATANRFCEKSPNNIRHMEHIDLFTNGNFRFIQIVRDGRDVILSRHPTAPDRYWVEPERWIRDVGIGLKYVNDPRVLTVKYEDVIQDYENTLGKICDFLSIDFTPELREWHHHARVTQNRAFFGKVEKISASSVEKWRDPKYADRIAQLTSRQEAVDLLRRYNYPVE